ncbi:hypothetical protein [Daejeonella sp.]|uniref:hypothetical protein n=1 Tax=Daejeonella sp. TaxID=2805397 RepID=UPI0030BB2716
MKQIKFNQTFIIMFTLITLGVTAFSFTSKFGLDSYEISLNNKVILKHYVNQPLNLRVLQLNKAKEGDQLGIRYTHCTIKDGAGTARSISVKDEKGNTLKKWAFADATGSNFNMIIAVNDLLKLEKAHTGQDLSIHYSARELPEGEMLSMLKL